MNTASLPVLWANCVELLKDRINNRSFWEALEATVPIAIENDTLIIGLEAANFNLASHIQHAAHLKAVQRVVEERFNQPLQVRLIEGTTPADWEIIREREARAAALRQTQTAQAVQTDTVTESWDALNDHLTRLYAQTPNRSLPQVKARYANEALYMLVEAMDSLYSDTPDEVAERNLARTLDRIANSTEIPAPVLAFELDRLRAWSRSQAEAGE